MKTKNAFDLLFSPNNPKFNALHACKTTWPQHVWFFCSLYARREHHPVISWHHLHAKRIISYTRENHLISDIIIAIIALTLVLTKNITNFCFAMLWTKVIHQNNVPKSSLGPNKGVALSEVWDQMSFPMATNSSTTIQYAHYKSDFNEDPSKKIKKFKNLKKFVEKASKRGSKSGNFAKLH